MRPGQKIPAAVNDNLTTIELLPDREIRLAGELAITPSVDALNLLKDGRVRQRSLGGSQPTSSTRP